MPDLLSQLGEIDTRWNCTGDIPVIDLSSLTHRQTPALTTINSPSARSWILMVVTCGIQFVAGEYASYGVRPRERWAFWAPVVIQGQSYDTIFTACRAEGGGWTFGFYCYGGDGRLHDYLDEHVFVAHFQGEDGRGRVTGRPWHTIEDSVLVTSFMVVSDGQSTKQQPLNLHPRSQFPG